MFPELVLASNNKGKAKELFRLLEPLNINVISQSKFDVPDVIEDGLTFVENAIKKARNAAYHIGKPAIADDSGIEVDALKGAPGIYSARFAGDGATDADNNLRLLKDLRDVPAEERTARFQCVMVLMRHHEDPTPIICQGTWEGQILFKERGDNGFGYDPLFLIPSRQLASAELSPELKNLISHRAQACRKLIEILDQGRIKDGDEVMQNIY